MELLKWIVATLPPLWQNELKRIHYRRQIRRGNFVTPEPEYAILPSLISAGDWVIDVGANVGHYTTRFSELVGTTGRVIAFEPVPETFALLAGNVQALSKANVTLNQGSDGHHRRALGIGKRRGYPEITLPALKWRL